MVQKLSGVEARFAVRTVSTAGRVLAVVNCFRKVLWGRCLWLSNYL